MKNRIVHQGIIGIFVSLYFLVATISMINSVAFFDLAHTGLMNWALAIGFELGAAASLAAIIILDKTNKTMVWSLFILLTAFQMMANSFHAFVNLEDFQGWIELFGLQDEELVFQKRVLSIVSGAVLPLVALGFIKSLTDYLKPNGNKKVDIDEYYEDRNQHLLNVVEKADKERRAANFAKAEYKSEVKEEESFEDLDEIEPNIDTSEKRHPADNVQVDEPQQKSNELEIDVDEETGTTYVRSINKSNPL